VPLSVSGSLWSPLASPAFACQFATTRLSFMWERTFPKRRAVHISLIVASKAARDEKTQSQATRSRSRMSEIFANAAR
jgi:hypothetical protein